jgi:hypothetical protein
LRGCCRPRSMRAAPGGSAPGRVSPRLPRVVWWLAQNIPKVRDQSGQANDHDEDGDPHRPCHCVGPQRLANHVPAVTNTHRREQVREPWRESWRRETRTTPGAGNVVSRSRGGGRLVRGTAPPPRLQWDGSSSAVHAEFEGMVGSQGDLAMRSVNPASDERLMAPTKAFSRCRFYSGRWWRREDCADGGARRSRRRSFRRRRVPPKTAPLHWSRRRRRRVHQRARPERPTDCRVPSRSGRSMARSRRPG